MAVLEILTIPDERLRTVAEPVIAVTDEIRATLDDMLETMRHDNGVGLAATQVDIHQRMFVMDISTGRDEPLYLVNTEITDTEGELEMEEGCLSVPGIYAKVTRPKKLTVKFLDYDGKPQELTVDGYAAKCIHHETDHLNGIIFVDHLSPLKRKMLDKKLRKLAKSKK